MKNTVTKKIYKTKTTLRAFDKQTLRKVILVSHVNIN